MAHSNSMFPFSFSQASGTTLLDSLPCTTSSPCSNSPKASPHSALTFCPLIDTGDHRRSKILEPHRHLLRLVTATPVHHAPTCVELQNGIPPTSRSYRSTRHRRWPSRQRHGFRTPPRRPPSFTSPPPRYVVSPTASSPCPTRCLLSHVLSSSDLHHWSPPVTGRSRAAVSAVVVVTTRACAGWLGQMGHRLVAMGRTGKPPPWPWTAEHAKPPRP
jgi:hypothetical protein